MAHQINVITLSNKLFRAQIERIRNKKCEFIVDFADAPTPMEALSRLQTKCITQQKNAHAQVKALHKKVSVQESFIQSIKETLRDWR